MHIIKRKKLFYKESFSNILIISILEFKNSVANLKLTQKTQRLKYKEFLKKK